MRFICLGYTEEKKWDAMSKGELEAIMEKCFAYDDVLRKNGHLLSGEALQHVRTAKTLRWNEGKVLVTDGPFAETKEQLGGILILEAKDRDQAIELMSKHPGVRFGGPFEIRPADEGINALIAERQDSKSTMSPREPQDWPRLFEQYLNAGDLDAVVALYEPEARFVARSGDTVVGRDRIRPVLAGLISSKTRLHSRIIKAVTVGDVALLYTDFEGTTLEASGKTVEVRHKAIEVLRRQPDGSWKLIVGDPNGRG